MNMDLSEVIIYTDGACSPNPGTGGWAAVVLKNGALYGELSGREEETTNNRMELTAALQGLRSLQEQYRVTLITDSTYVKNGITSWITGWKRRGWLTADRQPVKNRDLWEQLVVEIERHQVHWQWVRGHSQNRWNEHADQLAVAARTDHGQEKIEAVDGTGKTTDGIAVFCGITYAPSCGQGSWSAVLTYGRYTKVLGEVVKGDSANQVHLMAAVSALSALKRELPVTVYTTSSYLRDGLHSWLAGWQRRGWLTSQGKPVGNRRLWQQLAVLADRFSVEVRVVKRKDGFCLLQEAKELARQWYDFHQDND